MDGWSVWFETENRLCISNKDEKMCFTKETIMDDLTSNPFECDGKHTCTISTESFDFYCENGIKPKYENCKINSASNLRKIGSNSLLYHCESIRDPIAPEAGDAFRCVSKSKIHDHHAQIEENSIQLKINAEKIDRIIQTIKEMPHSRNLQYHHVNL